MLNSVTRACRICLLLYVPVGSLLPYGMRFLNGCGVRAPLADFILLGVFLLPFVSMFLWVLLAESFWSWMLAKSGVLRFAIKWAIPIYMLEAASVVLVFHDEFCALPMWR